MSKNAIFVGMIISFILIITTFVLIPINFIFWEGLANDLGHSLDYYRPDFGPYIQSILLTLLISIVAFIGGYLGVFKDSDIGKTMLFIMGIFAFFGMFIDLKSIRIGSSVSYYSIYVPMCQHIYYITNIVLLFAGIAGFPSEELKMDIINNRKGKKEEKKSIQKRQKYETDEYLKQLNKAR